MELETDLPTYGRPPLVEVAADMQFTSLPLKAVDIGAFHALIAAEYPYTLDVPPLMPSFETFGPGNVGHFGISVGTGLLPRSWFISADDEHVIQLQTDRLIVNWRMRAPDGGAYPRYPEVRQRFVAAHEALTTLVHRQGYPNVVPNQCDLTYINKVPLPDGAEIGDLHRLLRGIQLGAAPEWGAPFDEFNVLLRREVQNQNQGALAKLQIACSSIQIDLTQFAWALNVTVKGRPAAANVAAVLDFFDIAHVEIVRAFGSITTEAMHEYWEIQR